MKIVGLNGNNAALAVSEEGGNFIAVLSADETAKTLVEKLIEALKEEYNATNIVLPAYTHGFEFNEPATVSFTYTDEDNEERENTVILSVTSIY